MPTSASARAGVSSTPSPTMTTVPPRSAGALANDRDLVVRRALGEDPTTTHCLPDSLADCPLVACDQPDFLHARLGGCSSDHPRHHVADPPSPPRPRARRRPRSELWPIPARPRHRRAGRPCPYPSSRARAAKRRCPQRPDARRPTPRSLGPDPRPPPRGTPARAPAPRPRARVPRRGRGRRADRPRRRTATAPPVPVDRVL